MDIQEYLEVISKAARDTRSDYQITLGKAIERLENTKANMSVRYAKWGSPTHAHSYRGYYEDLAFESSDNIITVGDLLKELYACVDEVFQGYKGGDFKMEKNTPLWCAWYGSTGEAWVDFIEGENEVLIVTKEVD